jgi:hypothetical protein
MQNFEVVILFGGSTNNAAGLTLRVTGTPNDSGGHGYLKKSMPLSLVIPKWKKKFLIP